MYNVRIRTKRCAGFTLIETLVYIALLSFIVGGVLLTVYNLLQGSSALDIRTTVQDEGNFVLRKINWALSGASAVTIPSSDKLSVVRYDATSVDFQLNGLKIEMRENGGTFLTITTDNVQVTNVQFQKINTDPVGVSAVVSIKTINTSALDFTTTKYLRK